MMQRRLLRECENLPKGQASKFVDLQFKFILRTLYVNGAHAISMFGPSAG
jgi:hypothetical protein